MHAGESRAVANGGRPDGAVAPGAGGLAPASPWSRIPWPLVLLFAVLATRAAALCTSFFSGDEATYSALASRILSGALPYASAVDHKPVGIELTYAAIYALVGRNHLLAVRLVMFGAVWLTGLVLSRLGQRIRGDCSGRFAGLAYVIATTWGLPGALQSANTELFLNLPLCLAAAHVAPTTFDEHGRERLRLFLAGVLTAVAALYKYQSALAGCAWALAVWLADGSVRARIGRLAWLAAGFAVIAVSYVGYFALSGAWDAFAFWGWGFNFFYMAAIPGDLVMWNAVRFTLQAAAFWLPLLLLVRVPSGPAARLALPWVGVMLLSVTTGGRFFAHYYLMALPPVCLLAFTGRRTMAGWRWPLALGLGALLTVACITLSFTWYRLKPNLQAYDQSYRAVAAFVDQRSGADDRIFVWGNSPEIYYYADRVMGTRFPFCNYHTGKIWGTPSDDLDATGTEAFVVPRAWTELLGDLDATPPRFIIDGGAGELDRYRGHPIDRYPELASFVHRRYRLVGEPAGVPVFELQQ